VADSRSIPPTRVLFIDLDIIPDEPWLKHYRRKAELLLESYGLHVTSIKITPSEHKGLHVRIYLDKPIPANQALPLQFLLCDDHSRSAFNSARVEVGYAGWNKLHEVAEWNFPHHHSSGRNKNAKRR